MMHGQKNIKLTVLLEDESEQVVTLVKLSGVLNCHESCIRTSLVSVTT